MFFESNRWRQDRDLCVARSMRRCVRVVMVGICVVLGISVSSRADDPYPAAVPGARTCQLETTFEAMEDYLEDVLLDDPTPDSDLAAALVAALYVDWQDPAVNFAYQQKIGISEQSRNRHR